MLDPEDIEAIRRVIRDELDRYQTLEEKREGDRERARRYRERKRDASRTVTERHTLPQENVTENHATVTQRHAPPGKNGAVQNDLPLPPLSPPQTPPLNLPHPTRTHYACAKNPMMNKAALEEFKQIPIYAGIDIEKEAWKFKTWCEENSKPQTRRRFLNWLNRIT